MSAPISDDGADSEHSPYAPKWVREQPPIPAAQRSPNVSMVPSSETVHHGRRSDVPVRREVDQYRRARSESDLWPIPIPEPPPDAVRRPASVSRLQCRPFGR